MFVYNLSTSTFESVSLINLPSVNAKLLVRFGDHILLGGDYQRNIYKQAYYVLCTFSSLPYNPTLSDSSGSMELVTGGEFDVFFDVSSSGVLSSHTAVDDTSSSGITEVVISSPIGTYQRSVSYGRSFALY